MPEKCERSGSTLRLMPWNDTQWRTRMPMAAILSSAPAPFSGRRTQTPTRSSRRSPVTLNSAERGDDPVSRAPPTKARTSSPRRLQVEHHIGHALAGPVIGVLPAAAAAVDREAVGIDQVAVPRAGARRIERRMLEEPDELRRLASGNGGDFGAPCGRVRPHRERGPGPFPSAAQAAESGQEPEGGAESHDPS